MYQKLSPTSIMVHVIVCSIFMLHHTASSPYNFNIQFPMYTLFIIHVHDFTLNTSTHPYYAISIAPPTGHRNSDKHPIYMIFIVFSSISYIARWHATKRWAHLPTASLPINNQNTTGHKFVWGFFSPVIPLFICRLKRVFLTLVYIIEYRQ